MTKINHLKRNFLYYSEQICPWEKCKDLDTIYSKESRNWKSYYRDIYLLAVNKKVAVTNLFFNGRESVITKTAPSAAQNPGILATAEAIVNWLFKIT